MPGTPAAPGTPSAPDASPPLKRALGPKLLILFVIGDILGTGIYATTGDVAGKVGGALWLPFAIGFVGALLTAASYVELVGKYPKAGGVDFPPKLFAPIALFAVTNSALINLMTASRLCYSMADERILPPGMGKVPAGRRTPWAGIVFVSLLAIGPVSAGEIEGLGDTTSFLLLCVFGVVNIAVLVPRKDRVEHRHFRTPTALPVLGAITSPALAGPLADRGSDVHVRAGILLLIGIGLWAVDKAVRTAHEKSGKADGQQGATPFPATTFQPLLYTPGRMYQRKMPEPPPAVSTLRSLRVTAVRRVGRGIRVPGIDECLLEVMRLPGARGASVVDWTSGLALGTIGESPNGDHEATAAETAEVARMTAEQPAFAHLASGGGTEGSGEAPSPAVEDVIVTTQDGYHMLRFVETAFDSSVFLHLWLSRSEGNLAMARLRLGELAQRLVLA